MSSAFAENVICIFEHTLSSEFVWSDSTWSVCK